MAKRKIFERFASVELLRHLALKIKFLFKSQRYIQTILEDAFKRSRMVAILGREGMGKSTAIANYLEQNTKVYYLRIGKTYAINNFFNELLYQLTGVYPTVSDSLFLKMKMISHQLTEDNSKKMVIVDDAGQLSPRALSVFFELRDNTIYTTAFVFLGLEYFQQKLLAAKGKVPGCAEFYRRVESWMVIPGLHESEIAEYGRLAGLTDDQLLELKDSKVKTISELENLTNTMLEEQKEYSVASKSKSLSIPSGDDQDSGEVFEEDEFEEVQKLKKKLSAAKARAAKAKKQSRTKVTSDVASS